MTTHITASTLRARKQSGEKSVWLTAYDAPSATLAELAGVDVLLVGDSVGMVSLGFDSTVPVTLEHMIHHTQAVMRARQRAWVVCDLPFGSYQQSPQQAFASATRIMQETGCDAVKLEGGAVMVATIDFLTQRGVAVVAHLGLLPQSIKQLGTYSKQGTTEHAAQQLLADALAMQHAGASAIVLECIPQALAKQVTESLEIPTVGIGAGTDCDAQVLVWHDVLGLSEHNPSFAPAYANLRHDIVHAIRCWTNDVRAS